MCCSGPVKICSSRFCVGSGTAILREADLSPEDAVRSPVAEAREGDDATLEACEGKVEDTRRCCLAGVLLAMVEVNFQP